MLQTARIRNGQVQSYISQQNSFLPIVFTVPSKCLCKSLEVYFINYFSNIKFEANHPKGIIRTTEKYVVSRIEHTPSASG